jgi:hypothetical protein
VPVITGMLGARLRIWSCPCCTAPQAIYERDIINAPVVIVCDGCGHREYDGTPILEPWGNMGTDCATLRDTLWRIESIADGRQLPGV